MGVLADIVYTYASDFISSLGPEEIFIGILGFSWATYTWEEYLAYRQRAVIRQTKVVPVELREVVDHATFEKARAYTEDKSVYALVEGAWSQLLGTGMMVLGGLPLLWSLSGRALAGMGGQGEILHTVVFVALMSTLNAITSLPWSAYYTFKIEQKHGFNKETVPFFLQDKLKKFVISQLITAPVCAGLVFIINAGGDFLFAYLWAFTTSVLLFFMTVYPDCIAPLFDKYSPLPEGDLRSRIEALADRIHFPLKKLYVVEGSKRSAHSNAYFYGFFNNKRIVLYDTLLQDYTPLNKEGEEESTGDEEVKKTTGCSTEEVLAVLGHELGHWKLNHVFRGIVISQLNLLLIFSAFGLLHRWAPLYEAFGFAERPALIGLMIVMQYVFAPYNELLSLFMNMFSRYNEFQADAFAVSLGYSKELGAALAKLNSDNLSFPCHDHLYSAWHHSHPPLLQRLRALKSKEE